MQCLDLAKNLGRAIVLLPYDTSQSEIISDLLQEIYELENVIFVAPAEHEQKRDHRALLVGAADRSLPVEPVEPFKGELKSPGGGRAQRIWP